MPNFITQPCLKTVELVGVFKQSSLGGTHIRKAMVTQVQPSSTKRWKQSLPKVPDCGTPEAFSLFQALFLSFQDPQGSRLVVLWSLSSLAAGKSRSLEQAPQVGACSNTPCTKRTQTHEWAVSPTHGKAGITVLPSEARLSRLHCTAWSPWEKQPGLGTASIKPRVHTETVCWNLSQWA